MDYKSRQAPRRGACSAGALSRARPSPGAHSSPIVWPAGAGQAAHGQTYWSACTSVALCARPHACSAPRARARAAWRPARASGPAGPRGASCGRRRRRARRRQPDAR